MRHRPTKPVIEEEQMLTVIVDPEVRQFFVDAVINGHGGFQSLCRMLAERLRPGRTLRLRPDEFRRVVRYASSYGSGGFQTRLRSIVTEWVHQNLNTVVKG